MKKLICMLLLLVMLVTLVTPVASAAATQSRYYSDVYTTSSYHDAVIYLYEHGIMEGTQAVTGTQKGLFSPNMPLSRGQLVTILWRMVNEPESSGTDFVFSDVSESSYYYDAVHWASSAEVGITNGYTDGTFRPARVVTQQEALTFLYRFTVYCQYVLDSMETAYLNVFAAAPLTNKNSFQNYAKAAVGWAYLNGFLPSNSIVGTDDCKRSHTAEYAYQLYMTYQKKYGLAVVNTFNMDYVEPCGPAMQTLFQHYGASEAVVLKNVTKSRFANTMETVFSEAKPLDICYLYCASHGTSEGLQLFYSGERTLTPAYLRNRIEQYYGTFVVFISGCQSGTYIKQGDGSDCFDAENFMSILTAEEDSTTQVMNEPGTMAMYNLRDSHRMKVICSSEWNQVSYNTSAYATKYWCLGCGYDLAEGIFVTIGADTNSDSKISLYELFKYAHDKVEEKTENFDSVQTMVCYPENDSFIIFESGH